MELTPAELVDYPSPLGGDESDDSSGNESDDEQRASSGCLPAAPPLKRRKLEVSVREQHRAKQANRVLEFQNALADIKKFLLSKKTHFDAGTNSLQEYRARAIQSYFVMVVRRGRLTVDASERAAESQGFAAKWGGRSVRKWTRTWIKERKLPTSQKGRHAKVYSLLDDPTIRAELRAYVRSKKWSMDPGKLAAFTHGTLIPAAADKYLRQIVQDEMPRGLKKYMEVELLPRVQLKVGSRTISLSTARRWLHREGFKYIGHKKGLYFDGHDHPDVKGVGRGLHRSDVICSTVGHIPEAGEELEYGKNYDGYWTGELFCKQLRTKILPGFEARHGPGYQALIIVDNSQGHSAYSDDALLVSRMNTKPGGKQARMRAGWFIKNGQRVIQPMIFPPDHADHPDEPKGIKRVLLERGFNLNFIEFFWGMVKRYLRKNCDDTFDTLKKNMPAALASVQLATIRRWEHRMDRWMEAYRNGMETQAAQLHVRNFGSKQYISHRRIPERVYNAYDQ
ncbi:hypothetical protein K438DRAFT_1620770 [Mycena galopus ATCC 62051]|nr:hypothetical protein K438DRAFT_1620770 [Mycena galopus ATCC 62051]